jgi:hypothetical protein
LILLVILLIGLARLVSRLLVVDVNRVYPGKQGDAILDRIQGMAVGTSNSILSTPQFTMALRARKESFYGSQVILHCKKWSTSRLLFHIPVTPDPSQRF